MTGALSPWASGSAYHNFCETEVDPSGAFSPRPVPQLKAIKSMVDSDGLFLGNHAIPRLYEDGRPTH